MKKTLWVFLVAIIGICTSMIKPLDDEAKQQEKVYRTFLNDKITSGGIIPADSILFFMSKNLFSQDEKGVFRPVSSFMFTYIERGVYVNNEGKAYIDTEIYGTGSDKGVVPELWCQLMKDRLKSGDTVIFNNPQTHYIHEGKDLIYSSPKIVLIVK